MLTNMMSVGFATSSPQSASMPNPFLAGAPRPPRCSTCDILLLDGRCLECGAMQTPEPVRPPEAQTTVKRALPADVEDAEAAAPGGKDADGSDSSDRDSSASLERAFDEADFTRDRLERRRILKAKRTAQAGSNAAEARAKSEAHGGSPGKDEGSERIDVSCMLVSLSDCCVGMTCSTKPSAALTSTSASNEFRGWGSRGGRVHTLFCSNEAQQTWRLTGRCPRTLRRIWEMTQMRR